MAGRLSFRLWLESDEEEAGTPPADPTPGPIQRKQAILHPAPDEPGHHLRDIDAEPRTTHPDVVGWYRPVMERLLKAHLALNCTAVVTHPKGQKGPEVEEARTFWLHDATTDLYNAHEMLQRLMHRDDNRTTMYQEMAYAVVRIGNAIESLPKGGTRAISAINGAEAELNQMIATFSRIEPGIVDDAISELMGDEDVASWTAEAERISGLPPDRHGRRFWTLVNSWGSPDNASRVPKWNLHPSVIGNVRQHNADTAAMRKFGLGRPPRPQDHPAPPVEEDE